jgi:hypothetical protein
VQNTNNNKYICLSDLTNLTDWKDYVIYADEVMPGSNVNKTVKDKI